MLTIAVSTVMSSLNTITALHGLVNPEAVLLLRAPSHI